MTLLFFTSSYPYGKGETFIENEINFLAEHFDEVLIFPLNSSGEKRSHLDNVCIVDLIKENKTTNSTLHIYHSSILKEYFYLSTKLLLGKITFIQYRYLISLFKNILERATSLEKWLKENPIKDFVFYSYWFEEWATILAILKNNGLVNKFHARVHGFDLYEERAVYGFIPFRDLQLKEVTTVSAVSKAGYDYMIDKYPSCQQKFFLHRLGVHDNGIGPFVLNNGFTLVSCSNVVPLKRVKLIVDILTYVNQPMKWIHFGDGVQLKNIKNLAKSLPPNVSVDFRGRIANHEVVRFYKQHQVNLFITTTETEGGCPVSIQEAISFGIPVIGTAVGGVPEIVNSKTGILIDKDFDAKVVAKQIEGFLLSDSNSVEFREQVRKFWKEEFMAEINFKRYIHKILID